MGLLRGTQIGSEKGLPLKSYERNNHEINRHWRQSSHRHTVYQLKVVKERSQNANPKQLLTEDVVNKITNHHMVAVYTAAKIGSSFRQRLFERVKHRVCLIYQIFRWYFGPNDFFKKTF